MQIGLCFSQLFRVSVLKLLYSFLSKSYSLVFHLNLFALILRLKHLKLKPQGKDVIVWFFHVNYLPPPIFCLVISVIPEYFLVKLSISFKRSKIQLASCFSEASVFRRMIFLNEDHLGGWYLCKICVKVNFSVQAALILYHCSYPGFMSCWFDLNETCINTMGLTLCIIACEKLHLLHLRKINLDLSSALMYWTASA